MKKLVCVASALLALTAATSVRAGEIIDDGARAFWGADGSNTNAGDVIGGSIYDIQGATIVRVGSILTITIFTDFAGHAGAAPTTAPKGVGYGDLFLANTWSPNGTDAHHAADKATNSTKWTYGLSIDSILNPNGTVKTDRWNNTGGDLSLYKLNGASNASNISNSDTFMTSCGTGCNYRNGQEVAVKTGSSSVADTGKNGKWTVDFENNIKFTIDVAGTDLMNFAGFAMHWGETCQNDVIEGFTQAAPEPASIALLMLGIGGLAYTRRRRVQR